jgi:hypothetical protein
MKCIEVGLYLDCDGVDVESDNVDTEKNSRQSTTIKSKQAKRFAKWLQGTCSMADFQLH